MKKNILAIAILAAVVANIILSAVTLFAVVPAANKANKLVEMICTVINLELENPDASTYAQVPLSSRKPFLVGSGLTVNLKKADGETKNRYALMDCTLILNADAPNYKEVEAIINDQTAVLNDYLMSLVKGYTADELMEKEAEVKGKMLSYSRTYFKASNTQTGDELVVDVALNITIQ